MTKSFLPVYIMKLWFACHVAGTKKIINLFWNNEKKIKRHFQTLDSKNFTREKLSN